MVKEVNDVTYEHVAAPEVITVYALCAAWPRRHLVGELIDELGVLLMAAAISGRIFCTMYIGGQKNRTLLREGPIPCAAIRCMSARSWASW